MADTTFETTEAEVLRFLLQRGDTPTIEIAVKAILEVRKQTKESQ